MWLLFSAGSELGPDFPPTRVVGLDFVVSKFPHGLHLSFVSQRVVGLFRLALIVC